MKTKEFTIFDFLKEIIDKKSPWSSFSLEQKKQFNKYLISKFLSMNEKYLEIVMYVSSLPNLDEEKTYKIYCDFIPKNWKTYHPYIKSKVKIFDKEILKNFSEYYLCSFEEANEYCNLIGKDGIKSILESKGLDDKQIKKLVK